MSLRLTAPLLFALASLCVPSASAVDWDWAPRCPDKCVRVLRIHYASHSGKRRAAYVIVPGWYRPRGGGALPLIVSPHGRGVPAIVNVRRWGILPALGGFAVVNPDGEGRRLGLYSWGYPGQIRDLARMPGIVARKLPWLRIDRAHVYAFGTSMGGQEALLLAARYPTLLAGAAAFDSVVDMARRYRQFPRVGCNRDCRLRWKSPLGRSLQELARYEIGGTPRRRPRAYARRSPIAYARILAFSGVPLQLWWSRADRVVVDQHRQSARLARVLYRLNPAAPVSTFSGSWHHSDDMKPHHMLVRALTHFSLFPGR